MTAIGSTKLNLSVFNLYFLHSYSRPCVDDRRVISGIIHVIRSGLRWKDALNIYGPD